MSVFIYILSILLHKGKKRKHFRFVSFTKDFAELWFQRWWANWMLHFKYYYMLSCHPRLSQHIYKNDNNIILIINIFFVSLYVFCATPQTGAPLNCLTTWQYFHFVCRVSGYQLLSTMCSLTSYVPSKLLLIWAAELNFPFGLVNYFWNEINWIKLNLIFA